MKLYLYCILICFLCSCTLVKRTEAAMEKADKALAVASDAIDRVAQAKKEADTDGDGKTSLEEWMLYLLGGGGVAGGAVLRKRNQQSDARKAETEKDVAALKTEIAVMQAKEQVRIEAAKP